MTSAEITTAARNAFHAALEGGLDNAAALDNAAEAIRSLVGDRTGTFDGETLTWTFDEIDPETATVAEIVARHSEVPSNVAALSAALARLEGGEGEDLGAAYAALWARYDTALRARTVV